MLWVVARGPRQGGSLLSLGVRAWPDVTESATVPVTDEAVSQQNGKISPASPEGQGVSVGRPALVERFRNGVFICGRYRGWRMTEGRGDQAGLVELRVEVLSGVDGEPKWLRPWAPNEMAAEVTALRDGEVVAVEVVPSASIGRGGQAWMVWRAVSLTIL